MTSFYPPKDTPLPTRYKINKLVGRRRAIRYLMMFGSSFVGALVGSVITQWLLR